MSVSLSHTSRQYLFQCYSHTDKLLHWHLDKTQLVGGSWWWDPWIGSQPNISWVRREKTWDPMKGSHESRSTHSLGFVFILWCFFEYISSKIIYFYLKYYGLFLYSKSSRSPITASKMFHITAPWHHSKHPLSYHNEFVMLSRQLCDVTMDCHWYQTIMWQTAWIFYTRSRKTWIFYTRFRWWENMDISTQKLNLPHITG